MRLFSHLAGICLAMLVFHAALATAQSNITDN